MLSMLHIENIAVIDKADIELDVGFNVMTGETGAGKSIVIDAIGAVLGGRTSRDIIRSGAQTAMVSAVFYGIPDAAKDFLRENGIQDETEEILIQREIFSDGRNVCRLNGRPFTVTLLKTLGNMLLNIHGQHDAQQLLDESRHLSYLDGYSQDGKLLSSYAQVFFDLQNIKREMDGLITNEEEKEKRREILQYTINEIESASLEIGEEEKLLSRRMLLKNAGRIIKAVEDVYFLFYGDENENGICSRLSDACRLLSGTAALSDELTGLSSKVEELSFSADDVSGEIRRFKGKLDSSPGELEAVEERLDIIYRLKQKYGKNVEDILNRLEKSKSELERIDSSQEKLEALKKEYEKQYKKVLSLSEQLSDVRKKAAENLEKRIISELKQLDMNKVQFCISFSDDRKLKSTGADEISFLISTNLGEPPRPISRVASGGELARIMLALKNVLAETDDVPTLIFDEVDSGVSGRAAQRVAEKLHNVSDFKQVLCVTHLPQIAAMAKTHFLIEKGEYGGRTITKLKRLSHKERADELARLTGGAHITDITLKNAEELIHSADLYKHGRGNA